MNQKVKVLGCASIREKIVRYLFERKNTDGTIRGNLVREEMAEYMNVTRPSLSRNSEVCKKKESLRYREEISGSQTGKNLKCIYKNP